MTRGIRVTIFFVLGALLALVEGTSFAAPLQSNFFGKRNHEDASNSPSKRREITDSCIGDDCLQNLCQHESKVDANPPGAFVELSANAKRLSVEADVTVTAMLSAGATHAIAQWRDAAALWQVDQHLNPPPNLVALKNNLCDPDFVGVLTARTFCGDPRELITASPFTYRGWTYTYDAFGRVTQAAVANFQNANLAGGAQPKVNTREFVRQTSSIRGPPTHDDAGHIRANCLGGTFHIINFIGQNPVMNQRIQCPIEVFTKALVDNAVPVQAGVDITIVYSYPATPLAGHLPTNFFRPTWVQYSVVDVGGNANHWGGGYANGHVFFDQTFGNP